MQVSLLNVHLIFLQNANHITFNINITIKLRMFNNLNIKRKSNILESLYLIKSILGI